MITVTANRTSRWTKWMTGAAAALLLGAVSANAGTIKLNDSYGSGNGGEFRVDVFTGGSAFSSSAAQDHRGTTSIFQTFCIEANEFLSFNTTYYWQLNTAAIQGGTGGGNPDPLDPRTAYLYTQFCDGTLSNFHYLPNGTANAQREADAAALQKAIWFLEDESLGSNAGQAGVWITEATNAVTNNLWSGIGNVRVLNMYANPDFTGDKQDQLVMITSVPLPGAASAGVALLGALAAGRVVRRRLA